MHREFTDLQTKLLRVKALKYTMGTGTLILNQARAKVSHYSANAGND